MPHFHAGNNRCVVRRRDLVLKIKIARNFFSGVFVGDSRKFPAIRYEGKGGKIREEKRRENNKK